VALVRIDVSEIISIFRVIGLHSCVAVESLLIGHPITLRNHEDVDDMFSETSIHIRDTMCNTSEDTIVTAVKTSQKRVFFDLT
jgi:hypothetical protein